METLRNAYLLVLSAWMVCVGSTQPINPPWNNLNSNVSGKTLVLPFRASIAVTIVVLATLITITFLLLVYAKHRRVTQDRGRRRALIVHPGPGLVRPVLSPGILPRRDTGVDRSVIDALPVFKFVSLQGTKEGLECAVCLSRFEGPEVLRLLPKCRHAFHVDCVDTWLESNSTCPLCRQKVEAEDVFMVYRHEDVEEDKGLDDRAPQLLQAFVQRDNVGGGSVGSGSESSRFAVPGSFGQPSGRFEGAGSIGCFGSGRKKGLLISEADEESKELQFSRRFAHRIVVSDAMSQHRWSDIKHSDLLFLSSQMITTDSGRMGFSDLRPTVEMETKRKMTETKRLGGSSARIGQKRSMSEIIGFNRSCSRNNNALLPVIKCRGGDEQKWFSIAEKTVHSLASNGDANDKGVIDKTIE